MLREIEQQPEALQNTLDEAAGAIEKFKQAMQRRRPSLIVLAARGTSDNAALFGRYLLEMTTGIPVSLAAPSVVTVYEAPLGLKDALVIGISQSGESTDTILFLEAARRQGALTVAVTNHEQSSITRAAQEIFLVRAGREQSVAATKTYTGQMLMFYLLAYALGSPVSPAAVGRLPAAAEEALARKDAAAALSERYRYMSHAAVVGRGLNYANAFEFSLKLMETCYVVAERFSTADFLHGPIALVERAFPVFVFAPPGPTLPGVAALCEKLRLLQAETVVISGADSGGAAPPATRNLALEETVPTFPGMPQDIFTPIPYIIPAQLFTVFLSRQKGLDPDRPRTLSKVTKTI